MVLESNSCLSVILCYDILEQEQRYWERKSLNYRMLIQNQQSEHKKKKITGFLHMAQLYKLHIATKWNKDRSYLWSPQN